MMLCVSQAQYVAKDGEECNNLRAMPDSELYLMAQVRCTSLVGPKFITSIKANAIEK